MNIPGIPETITRAEFLALQTAIGLPVEDVVSLEFRRDGVYAEVYAKDDNGEPLTADKPGDEYAPAIHKVFIRVVDEPAAS